MKDIPSDLQTSTDRGSCWMTAWNNGLWLRLHSTHSAIFTKWMVHFEIHVHCYNTLKLLLHNIFFKKIEDIILISYRWRKKSMRPFLIYNLCLLILQIRKVFFSWSNMQAVSQTTDEIFDDSIDTYPRLSKYTWPVSAFNRWHFSSYCKTKCK